ncbi:hypothetical protein AB0L70_27190 [Kribbella sp. NPDC051952]|uniref:hypothetical protein n=1 Tax=Kribbella sp. NPDC051952 TaxID=3154851 RepID=UPI003424087F
MAELSVQDVITAATRLRLGAQWDAAAALLRATDSQAPAERRAIAVALAEVLVDQDFAQLTDHGGEALAAATQAVDTLPDATSSWDVEMLRLRKDYSRELFRKDDSADGERVAKELAAGFDGLQATAPDNARQGMAFFYAGLVADHFLTDPDQAYACYREALDCGDDLVGSFALRHLGDHAHTAGDLKLAREQWELSTEVRQEAGFLFGVLAQQALLASLLSDEGDAAGSRALAGEINRWARQLRLPYLIGQTDDLMA